MIMEEILHYLELKNQYYEKFCSMSAKYLARTYDNQWEDLAFFVDNRERILNIIRSFDFKIAKLFDEVDPTALDLTMYRPRVKSLLDRRSELAKRIVEVDLELISRIDDFKSDTIRDLKKTQETSHQMDSFATVSIAHRPRKPVKSA
jgi:hypothetical protein